MRTLLQASQTVAGAAAVALIAFGCAPKVPPKVPATSEVAPSNQAHACRQTRAWQRDLDLLEIAGEIVFENRLPPRPSLEVVSLAPRYELQCVWVAIDGEPWRVLPTTNAGERLGLPLSVGPHEIRAEVYVVLDAGIGMYARHKGYRVQIHGQRSFSTSSEMGTLIHLTVLEKGGPTTPLEDRPTLTIETTQGTPSSFANLELVALYVQRAIDATQASLARARADRDVILAICLNDRLLRLEATLRIVHDKRELPTHERSRFAPVLWALARGLYATQCVCGGGG